VFVGLGFSPQTLILLQVLCGANVRGWGGEGGSWDGEGQSGEQDHQLQHLGRHRRKTRGERINKLWLDFLFLFFNAFFERLEEEVEAGVGRESTCDACCPPLPATDLSPEGPTLEWEQLRRCQVGFGHSWGAGVPSQQVSAPTVLSDTSSSQHPADLRPPPAAALVKSLV